MACNNFNSFNWNYSLSTQKQFFKENYIILFLTSQILISVTSHFGGSMTHGVDYLKIPEFENKTALLVMIAYMFLIK